MAERYASTHWQGPPYGDGVYIDLDSVNGDCSNFVSQALWEGGLRDPRDPGVADNSDIPYWVADRAFKDEPIISDKETARLAGTWTTTALRRFLTEVLNFQERRFSPVPYVNGYDRFASTTNLEWIDFLFKSQIRKGDVVFYHQGKPDAYWNHAAIVVGWGTQTYFPDTIVPTPTPFPTPVPAVVGGIGKCFDVWKPLVVEHSTQFAYDGHQPRSIDNTGSPVIEISIVHIFDPIVYLLPPKISKE